MKIAYLDCFSGISGDMFLGALLDAGFAFEDLKHRLRTLPLDGYRLETKQELRNQISGTRFSVKLESEKQVPRNLEAIRKIIQGGDLSSTVKEKSTSIFEQLAGIEGKIHNLSPEKVHFHEVGAVDSIVDIVGSLIGIEHLKIRSVYASHIPLGSGFTETAHGTIPIPAPATIELLKGIPVYDSDIRHEMVTPTGAALLKCLVSSFGPMPPMVVQDVGYGAGKRDLPERPNLLRILIGDEPFNKEVESVVLLETNLDDTSPEWIGYLMERLFEAGALDVVFFPIQMKKNRPGVQIQVIGQHDQRETLTEILFRESATLGVRFRYTQRQVLKRAEAEVDSPWGSIKVKKIMNRDGSYFFQPEYDVCREIALKYNRPLREIYHWVMGLNT
jgi:uncharacterized protein (TIGR00299 family) protein